MSNSDTDSSCGYNSDDSEFKFLPGYVLEVEGEQDTLATSKELTEVEYSDTFIPYADEPIANQEWLDDYEKQQESQKELERKLQSRCDEEEGVSSWCQCGNCRIDYLQNPNEFQCCVEIEECVESLSSEIVLEESVDIPKCITFHPGFEQVCLSKSSLRLAADKYKRKDKSRYRQTGSEERFLRSTAYREFTRLVHGYLGGRRIPLPVCAYYRIREKFKDTAYKGFEVEDNDNNDDEEEELIY